MQKISTARRALMSRPLRMSVWLASIAILPTLTFSTLTFPTLALAQTPSAPAAAPAAPSAPAASGAAAPAPTNVPSGTPEGVDRLPNRNSAGFPAPQTIEGQPIETRPPELAADHPLVPGQTRAPYHKSVPYTVTTITDQLKAPWSLAFLPDRKMLVTEKNLGEMLIVDGERNDLGAADRRAGGSGLRDRSASWTWCSIRNSPRTSGFSSATASR